ncbi:MAG: hypothetical protein Q9202_004938 [Teloschistes flavicans]
MPSQISSRSSFSFIRPTFTGRSQPVTRIRSPKTALQPSFVSSSIGRSQPISNRPRKSALQPSSLSTSTGRPQPISNRPLKSALQPSRPPPPTGRSQPIRIQPRKLALQPCSTSRATSVMERLAARRQRLAVTSPLPPPSLPARPAARQPSLPPTPQAPRAARFRDVETDSVRFPAFVKPTEVLRKGILKKTGAHRSTASKAVRWVDGDVAGTKTVDRWIVPSE